MRHGGFGQTVNGRKAFVCQARHFAAGVGVAVFAAQGGNGSANAVQRRGGGAEKREQALHGVLTNDAQAGKLPHGGPDVRVGLGKLL